MLDFFRNHKRMMMFLLVLVIVPGMGFVGIEGFRGFFDQSANVASVNGHKISRQEYDDAMRDQLSRARQALGASFDAKMLDTPAMRQALLDNMIQQRIIADETQRENLSASDSAVRSAILQIPAIAQLRKPDGSIDLDQYKRLLGMQGMTPEQFDERVRYDLASHQIQDSIESSAFAPQSLARHLTELVGQQRDLQSLVLKPSDYAARVQPSDTQLQQYYDSHRQEFETPETAQIQYLTLSVAALAAGITPTDAQLQAYYQDNIAQFRTAEEIRASHILISVAPNASAADRAQAKQKAETLLAEVKAHPDQFAAIAEKNSQDPGSASKGGDLGYFGRGMMVKPFEDAAFQLKKGEISGIVQSDFGYHIIEVTDIKPAVTKPFADVKDQVTAAVKSQQAEKLFADDADSFTDTVYEQAASLQPAADKFKLKIQTATVSRTPNPALAPTEPVNNPKFLAAVFTNDALKNKHNTAAVDLGNNTLISAHVTAYQPATVQPFAAVRQQVRQKVVAEQSAVLAKQDGAAKLAALQKSKATDGFSPVMKVSRNDPQGLPAAALAQVFQVDAHKLPAYVGIDLSGGSYAIYRVNAIQAAPAATPQQLAAAGDQLAQVSAQAELDAYLSALRDRSKVKLYGTPPAESSN